MPVQRPCRASLWSLVAVVAATAGVLVAAPARAATPVDVVSRPGSFAVVDTNTSGVPCPSDGARYTVRGHLTGPPAALTSRRAEAVTVYLYGEEAGEWNWHLTSMPAYDHATQMARLGHVSLTIDELGYGASGRPSNGNLTCQGAEADITHQIVQQLRSGTYASGSTPGVSFSHVVLAGHDVGAEVAEIEAYSYADI